MSTFNKIQVVGFLGKDPEIRYTPQGTAVCNFSIASTKKKNVSGEKQEFTTWFNVTAWGQRAELISQYCEKGSYLFVEGELTQGEWTDRDGNTRTSLDIELQDVRFLANKNGGARTQSAGASAASRGNAQSEAPQMSDEVPF